MVLLNLWLLAGPDAAKSEGVGSAFRGAVHMCKGRVVLGSWTPKIWLGGPTGLLAGFEAVLMVMVLVLGELSLGVSSRLSTSVPGA